MNLINSQLLLSKVEHFADEIGLKINVTKTKYICIGEEHDDNIKLYVESGFIERVDDFKYLGSWIKNSAKEISCRIGTAFTAAKQFKLIWRSQLSRKLKRLFFMSTIQSILFYACESWSLTKTLKNRINGAYTRLLRYSLNIS